MKARRLPAADFAAGRQRRKSGGGRRRGGGGGGIMASKFASAPAALLAKAAVAALSVLFLVGTTSVLLLRELPPPTSSSAAAAAVNLDRGLGSCFEYGCPVYPVDVEKAAPPGDGRSGASSSLSLGKNISSSGGSLPIVEPSLATRQSNRHPFNQDRAVVFEPYLTRQTPPGTKSFLVTLLDGHAVAGHLIAEYVSHALPKLLAKKLSARPCCHCQKERQEEKDPCGDGGEYGDWIRRMLNETFVEVNLAAPRDAALRGGTTASVTLRVGSRLYVANAGDSQTLVVRSAGKGDGKGPGLDGFEELSGMKHEIVYRTRRDKAHLPDEKARIEGMGGRIHIPPSFPMGSRVVVFSKAARPPQTIALAMSRSIGDWEWKLVGVTAEPIVDVVEIQPGDDSPYFLIAASDGVWDMRRPVFFANRIGEHVYNFRRGIGRSGGSGQGQLLSRPRPPSSLSDACRQLILDVSPAKAEWYRDDMTLVVLPF